jgi:alpha-2-macroglobulin
LQIDLDRRVAYRGEQIEGTIRAEFPDGTPLQGAQVSYQLADQPAITIATDDRGHAPLRLSTRLFAESQVLTISARLPQWDVAAEANVLFAMQGFSVDVQTVRTRYLAGETFDVNLVTRDPEANPVAQSLKLKVFKLTSQRGRVIEHPHQEAEIRTDGVEGRGSTAITLNEAGRYRLRAEGTDARGTICSGQTTVVVSGEHDRHRLLMLADRREYRAGETCEVNLFWREPPTLALVTFETSRVLGYRLVPLNTGSESGGDGGHRRPGARFPSGGGRDDRRWAAPPGFSWHLGSA